MIRYKPGTPYRGSAWVTAACIFGCAVILAIALFGCDKAKEEPKTVTAPVVPPISTPPTLQPTVKVVEPAAPELVESAILPPGVPREVLKYRATIIRETRFYFGMEHRPALIMAQFHQESNFKATAQSKFASGLAQFTPPTAAGIQASYPKDLKELCGEAKGCPLDPHWAIRAGIIYDRDIWKVYKKAEGDERYAFMFASYNGGSGWIDRELKVCNALPAEECVSAKYFSNVELQCGKSTPGRADWACKENTHYPRVILFRWRPLYLKLPGG